MNRRHLGRTGLKVSPIGIGAAPFGYVNSATGWDPWSNEGRRMAIATIHRALDRGINYIDTAPAYGAGHAETLIGEVMRTRRQECVLATKVWLDLGREAAVASVHESLARLQTDYIDVVQIHGRMYTPDEYNHIINGGLLEGLVALRSAGKIGFIGLTADEPWTVLPFLQHPEFTVYQIAYNFIYQGAARHFLPESAAADVGVVTMRTMTSGVLQRAASYLAPQWTREQLFDVCLKFVLGDSRVHSALVGMRLPSEVDENVRIAETWNSPIDFATLPRLTGDVYKAEDAEIPSPAA